jgi:ketosteroid isomerase-like protein
MSEENVELVRRAYAALTRRDGDALYDLAASEFVVDFSRRLVDPFLLRGPDEALSMSSGKAVRLETYSTKREALEAAGLSQ